MHVRRVTLVTLLVAGALAGAAAASPSPVEVCGVCGDHFADAAADHGANVSVERSTLDVHVRADGSARWVVRNHLDPASAEALRENRSALDAIAGQAGSGPAWHPGLVENPRNVTARLDGDAVVVTFVVDRFARESVGGLLVADHFHVEEHGRYLSVAADRVAVHAPDGYVVTNRPAPDADASGGTVVWAADSHYGPHVGPSTYVVFGQDPGPATGVLTQAAVVADAAPFVVRDGVLLALVPTGIVATMAAGLAWFGDTRLPRRATVALALLAVAVAVLAVAVALDQETLVDPTVGGALTAFALVGGSAGVAAVAVPERLTFGRATGLVAVTAAVAWAAIALAAVARGWPAPVAGWRALTPAALGALPGGLLLLGYAAEARPDRRLPVAAAVVALPLLVALPMAPVGVQGVLAGILLAMVTGAAVVPGALLFLVGGGVARRRPGYRSA